MTANAATLINLIGFITGAALYTMLLVMVFRSKNSAYPLSSKPGKPHLSINRLLLLTAILGFSWNIGAFGLYGLHNLGIGQSSPLFIAVTFTTLGFLPAVVVHSVLRIGKT